LYFTSCNRIMHGPVLIAGATTNGASYSSCGNHIIVEGVPYYIVPQLMMATNPSVIWLRRHVTGQVTSAPSFWLAALPRHCCYCINILQNIDDSVMAILALPHCMFERNNHRQPITIVRYQQHAIVSIVSREATKEVSVNLFPLYSPLLTLSLVVPFFLSSLCSPCQGPASPARLRRFVNDTIWLKAPQRNFFSVTLLSCYARQNHTRMVPHPSHRNDADSLATYMYDT